MFKRFTSLLVGLGLLVGASQQASATIIQDNYYGHNSFGSAWNVDVISDPGDTSYDISNMDVTFSGGYMTVKVNTNFNQATDPYGVQFGDLFISTYGWHPNHNCSAPYSCDDATHTDNIWNYVLDTSANTLYGGNFTTYTSDHFFGGSGYIYRNNQLVQRDSGGIAYAGSSADVTHAGTGGYVQYNILLSSLGLTQPTQLGLRWGMTCANDVIEGAVNVPEPSALLLLGIGLLGLGLTARKRIR